jgi:hypothetical protein
MSVDEVALPQDARDQIGNCNRPRGRLAAATRGEAL